jgi:hypothetical protein
VNGERLQALHDMGMAGEQLGALRLYKGAIFVSVDSLTQMIGAATQIGEDTTRNMKERQEAWRTVGYLANCLSKVTTGAVKMDHTVVQAVMEVDQKRRNSFQPGQRVTGPQSQNPPINS